LRPIDHAPDRRHVIIGHWFNWMLITSLLLEVILVPIGRQRIFLALAFPSLARGLSRCEYGGCQHH
jgi:hypothetical protein